MIARRGQRRAAIATTILLASVCVTTTAVTAPSQAAAASVVPQFSVTSKLSVERRAEQRVVVVKRLRIAGIRGALRIGCAKCVRLPGRIVRTRGRDRSITMSNLNWIVTPGRSVLISVVRNSKVGRYTRLGVSAAKRSRLVYSAAGCMTSRRRLTPCPAGTEVITSGQSVSRLGSQTKPRTFTVPAKRSLRTPDELAIATTSASSITVSWRAATSPHGIYGYNVYLNGAIVAQITELSYTFSGLPCSTGYTIGVSATDQSGDVSPRLEVGAATQGCPAPPNPASASLNQTVGKQTTGARTWTDYRTGSGQQGQAIGPGETVAVSCRIEGLAAQDGNRWWYRIASGPWSDQFYAPADLFYNNGVIDGPLSGTPIYDVNVPLC